MSRSQVVTVAPNGSGRRYLGQLGPVAQLKYSWTLPGGCDQMSCLLQRQPDFRTEALNPGRSVTVLRGGGTPWTGKLDEPAPGPAGWQITAHGSGTFGSEHCAEYTGTWGAGVLDNAVNRAINRGMPWVNPGIGTPTGLWLGQAQDSGSLQIDELLNQACSNGGLTWTVVPGASGNTLKVLPLPTTPTHLLVVKDPAPRTLGGDINTVFVRYCTAPDLGTTPATFALTRVFNQASVLAHGEMEAFADIGSAGPLLTTDAQAVGAYILQRYVRASFAGPFTVRPGELLTLGGTPVDLGFFYATQTPMVCRLILLDEGWGGELSPGPVEIPVGAYEWDEDNQTATITPFNSLALDFQGLLAQRVATQHGRNFRVHPQGHKYYITKWIGHGKYHRKVRRVRYAPTWNYVHRPRRRR